MRAPNEGAGALRPVRLSDVPLEVRLAAAYRVQVRAMQATGIGALADAAEVEHAARHPSDTVYWVPASEVVAVLGPPV